MTGSRLEQALRVGVAVASLTAAEKLFNVTPAFGNEQGDSVVAARLYQPLIDQAPPVIIALPDDITRLYPDIDISSYPVKTISDIPTPTGKETTVYNLTDYSVDPVSLIRLYSFLENNAHLLEYHYVLNRNDRIFLPVIDQKIQKRATILVPPNAPLPGWNERKSNAITGYENTFSLTFIELPIDAITQGVDEETLETYLDIETCQNSLLVNVLDEYGFVIGNHRERMQAQEIFCNSIGFAIALSSRGVAYKDYVSHMNQMILTIPLNNVYQAHPIIVSLKTYKAMSKIGAIVHK